MKTTITFESFSELLAAFTKQREEGESFPVLNDGARLEVLPYAEGIVRLIDARDNGTTYEFEMDPTDFLIACCERLGIRTFDARPGAEGSA